MRKNRKCPQILIDSAVNGLKYSVAPYSKFNVSAALLTEDGKIITGANVESASYGLTMCAERVALFKALTEGHKNFKALLVIAPVEGGATPCGACRQLLSEYAPNLIVWLADSRNPLKQRVFTIKELLPEAFRLNL